MTVSDPMPKDKRTRAYKDWVKREKQRERMKELEGAVSLRGFTYQDANAQEKYASLSMMLAELRHKLLTDNSTVIVVSEGRLDSSGYTIGGVSIQSNSKYVTDFKNWVFKNQFSESGYYQQYPYLSGFQTELLEDGKEIPNKNQYGQPTRPEGNLGNPGKQCSWKVIGDNPGYTFRKDKLPYQEYIQSLYQSKMALSPFGQGEVCYRDFEVFEFGVLMLKPTMEKVVTTPNPYITNETYVPIDLDWKNLNEIVKKMLDNSDKMSYIINNARKTYDKIYSAHNFCMYWYNFFANLSGVEND